MRGNSGQAKISPNHRVRSYPLVDRGGMLWIWMGQPEQARVEDIPHFEPLEDPDWCGLPKRCYLHYDANWMLIVDNLADFSHLAFVHTNTWADPKTTPRSRPRQWINWTTALSLNAGTGPAVSPPTCKKLPCQRMVVDRRNFVRMYTLRYLSHGHPVRS